MMAGGIEDQAKNFGPITKAKYLEKDDAKSAELAKEYESGELKTFVERYEGFINENGGEFLAGKAVSYLNCLINQSTIDQSVDMGGHLHKRVCRPIPPSLPKGFREHAQAIGAAQEGDLVAGDQEVRRDPYRVCTLRSSELISRITSSKLY